MAAADLQSMGRTAATVLEESLSQSRLCNQFCDHVERALIG